MRFSVLDWLAMLLVLIGGINWGLLGFLDWDLVSFLFGDHTATTRLIYALIGLSGLWSMLVIISNVQSGESV